MQGKTKKQKERCGRKTPNGTKMKPWFPDVQPCKLTDADCFAHAQHAATSVEEVCIKPCGIPPARCFLICFVSACPKETSLKNGKCTSCYTSFLIFHICFWRFMIPLLSSYNIPMATVTAVNCHSQTIRVSSPLLFCALD